MQQRDVSIPLWILGCIMVVGLGTAAYNWIYHVRVMDRLELIFDQEDLKVLKTTWKSGGDTVSWTTTQGSNESITELAVRHKAGVVELKLTFPVDPPPSQVLPTDD